MIPGAARQSAAPGPAWLLLPLVMASGFAGLAYEVVWTRMLALVLGTEMAAVLGVVTGFFAGLALGALALDRRIRNAARVQHVYAALELVIAAWSVLSIALLPAAAAAIRWLLGTAPAPASLCAAGFILPAVILLPATAAMGGTLIALERLAAASRHQSRIAAGIYGANTAGAMLGALGTVFWFLPELGLSGTLLALAVVNLACAISALAIVPRQGSERPVKRQEERNPDAALNATRLLVLLAGTGLLGIAFEILVIRLAAQVLQDTIFTFAALLAAYLLGSALGGIAWQRTGWRPAPNAIALLLAGAATATLLSAEILRLPWLQNLRAGGSEWLEELAVAAVLLVPPSLLGGALFGCLCQAVRDRRGTLGQAVGVNAIGAAVAPALATLGLIPLCGASQSLIVVALGYLALSPVPSRLVRLAAISPIALAAALWWRPEPPPLRIPPGGAMLAVQQGPATTTGVVEDAAGDRFLEVNGHFRMGGTSSRRSDWRQAQLPLLLHPAPHRALFLGVGTGATLAGAAAMPGVAATGVELVPEVVAMLPWFAEAGAPALPPVMTADARRFVAADQAAYDVIVADLFHPALDGTGALYTTEHFTAIRQRLAEGGLFCQWLPLYQLDRPSLDAILRSFLAVFPEGSAWLAHFSLQTPMMALIGGRPPGADWPGLATRLGPGAMREATAPSGLIAPIDLLGLYLGDGAALSAFAGPGPVNTDDRPFVALDARRNVRALAAPPATLLLSILRETADRRRVPAAAIGPPPAAALPAYWQARDQFVSAGAAIPSGTAGYALIDAAMPGLLAAVRLSSAFDPAYMPLLGMAETLLAPGQSPAERLKGRALLQALDAAAPARPEARALLARLPRP